MPRSIAHLVTLLVTATLATSAFADSEFFHKQLAGKIGGRYAFTMDLKDVDGQLSGSYRYAGKPSSVYLAGRIDPSGAFTMKESNGDGKTTGSFAGKLAGGVLEANWTSGDGSRHLPVQAHQTSEVLIGTKREILTQAIGTWPLDTVEGSAGANAMWETFRVKGHWRSNTSSIEQAMRQFSPNELTRDDLRQLDSLSITVDTSLAVHLNSEGKVLLTIPYRDNGMQYDVTREHESVIADNLKQLSPSTTVHDEHLYLLVDDVQQHVPMIAGSFMADAATNIVTIDYSVVDKTFNVLLSDDNCCGSTALTFKRKQP